MTSKTCADLSPCVVRSQMAFVRERSPAAALLKRTKLAQERFEYLMARHAHFILFDHTVHSEKEVREWKGIVLCNRGQLFKWQNGKKVFTGMFLDRHNDYMKFLAFLRVDMRY